MIRLIVAVDRQNGLAKHGYQPWYIPEDEAYFASQTKSHGGKVLTGGVTFRNNYKGRPLPDRQNFILTHDTAPIPDATVVNDISQFLDDFKDQDIWVAGGSVVFKLVMDAGKADELYITHIDADFKCDQFFPDYQAYELAEQGEPKEQNGFHFYFARYVRQ